MNRRETPRRSWRHGLARSREWFVAGFFCCIALHAYGQSLKPTAERVVIDSRWAGLNPEEPFHTHIVLEKDGFVYRLTGGHSKSRYGKPLPDHAFPAQTIAPQQVSSLVDAMGAPIQPQVDLRNLDLTIDDVQHKIDDALKEAKISTTSAGLGAEVLAWRESLRNPRVLAETVTKGFDANHTDDGPFIHVEVTLSDGTKLTAQPRSQQYLMLPWTNARGERTYSLSISHALNALLPKEATNKERLDRTPHNFDFDEMLDFALSEPIDRFQAESIAPDAVRMLDENFKVISVSLDSFSDRPQLQTELQLPDSPTNLRFLTSFPLDGKTIANYSDILRIHQMLQLVQSSPALDAHIRSAPKADFYIFDNDEGERLNKRTATQFVNQMQQMKKLPELRTQPSLMRGAVMVEEGDMPIYWIVLADRRSIIWKQAGPDPGQKAAESCASIPMADSDPADFNDTCLGKVYGADGREQ